MLNAMHVRHFFFFEFSFFFDANFENDDANDDAKSFKKQYWNLNQIKKQKQFVNQILIEN